MMLEKYKPLLEEHENRKKKLNQTQTINYVIAALISCSSLAILILNLFSKSEFQLRLIVAIIECAVGIVFASFLVYITYSRKKKLIVAYNVTSGIVALTFDSFLLFFLISYMTNDSNYSQSQIRLSDVIIGTSFTLVQTLSLLIGIFFVIRMKKLFKQCKRFDQKDEYQVSLQGEHRISTPLSSPQSKQKAFKIEKNSSKDSGPVSSNRGNIIANHNNNNNNNDNNNQQIDFFENCSQYTNSVISDIENSLPSKKKKALKSIDALQNTDSDAANQKSQAKSDRNNSLSHHHQAGKYMSIQKNDQIFEGDDEEEDDEDYQVHNKILTPGNGVSFKDQSLSNNTLQKQKNTLESKSYYTTTIDLANNSCS